MSRHFRRSASEGETMSAASPFASPKAPFPGFNLAAHPLCIPCRTCRTCRTPARNEDSRQQPSSADSLRIKLCDYGFFLPRRRVSLSKSFMCSATAVSSCFMYSSPPLVYFRPNFRRCGARFCSLTLRGLLTRCGFLFHRAESVTRSRANESFPPLPPCLHVRVDELT